MPLPQRRIGTRCFKPGCSGDPVTLCPLRLFRWIRQSERSSGSCGTRVGGACRNTRPISAPKPKPGAVRISLGFQGVVVSVKVNTLTCLFLAPSPPFPLPPNKSHRTDTVRYRGNGSYQVSGDPEPQLSGRRPSAEPAGARTFDRGPTRCGFRLRPHLVWGVCFGGVGGSFV